MDLHAMPILEGLYQYSRRNPVRFHMPGHKGNDLELEELKYLQQHMLDFDITEVEGADNLFAPEGMIKASMELLKEQMGAVESHYLINGATCGIYAGILGLTNPGDRVLVQRNCHKSVHSAMYLGNLTPVYLYPQLVEDFGIPSGVSRETIRQEMDLYPDAKAVILTRPTYYGTCCNIKEIAELCRERGMYLLVDEAHGAHLSLSSDLPITAMEAGAHISVVSYHKSLPSMTQTAVLNMGEGIPPQHQQKIRQMLQMFQSTSPSYVLLASLDVARHIMASRGEAMMEELKQQLGHLQKVVQALPGIQLLSAQDLQDRDLQAGDFQKEEMDYTKIVLHTYGAGQQLAERLQNDYNILVEMWDQSNVVLIASIMDPPEYYVELEKALIEIAPQMNIQTSSSSHQQRPLTMPLQPVIRMSHREAEQLPGEEISLSASLGRIAGEMVIPYPPGVPILIPGEEISLEIIDYLEQASQSGRRILKDKSMKQNTIQVLK